MGSDMNDAGSQPGRAGPRLGPADAPVPLDPGRALVVLLYATGVRSADMSWHFWLGYGPPRRSYSACCGDFRLADQPIRRFRAWSVCRAAYQIAVFHKINKQASATTRLAAGQFALLLCVLVQAVTGLFATDEIDTDGPLVARVSMYTVKLMTRVHHWNENVCWRWSACTSQLCCSTCCSSTRT
jgi:cytochrome b